MGGDTDFKTSANSFSLGDHAAKALTVPASRLGAVRLQAQARLDQTIATWRKSVPLPKVLSVAFDADEVTGHPLVLTAEPSQGPSPFLPMILNDRIVTVPLVGERPASARTTAVGAVDDAGQVTLQGIYPGEPLDRLGEEDYVLAAAADSELVKLSVAAFGEDFARRLDPLHQAMRSFGLPAPDLRQQSGRLAQAGEKFIKFILSDAQADGAADREAGIEIIRNGNIFLGGRRYEPTLCKVVLSDAEIARTGLFRVEVDHEAGTVSAFLMTDDGRVAHIVLNAATPLEPTIEGKLPVSAFDVMNKRAESVRLISLARKAIAQLEATSGSLGLFARLFSAEKRQASADLALLNGYVQGGDNDGAKWAADPQTMRNVASAVLRRLPADPAGNNRRLALVAIGVGQVLGSKK